MLEDPMVVKSSSHPTLRFPFDQHQNPPPTSSTAVYGATVFSDLTGERGESEWLQVCPWVEEQEFLEDFISIGVLSLTEKSRLLTAMQDWEKGALEREEGPSTSLDLGSASQSRPEAGCDG